MFRFEQPRCPQCGEPPAGTLKAVPGLAELVEAGDGLFVSGGHTLINCDSQRTAARPQQVYLECPASHRRWPGLQVDALPILPEGPFP